MVLSAVIIATGFGCKGLSVDQQAAIRPVTLNYWTIFDDVDELKKLAADYKAKRPHISINIRQVRYDEFDKIFINALADDVQPDVVSMHTRWLRNYQARLAPMPATVKMGKLVLKNNITKDTEVQFDTLAMPTAESIKKDYLATVADEAIIKNQIYGLPLSIDTLGIYYNKDLLDKAGMPEPPKTWDEFSESVKRVTKLDQNGKLIQSGTSLGTAKNIDNAFDIVSALMMQNGISMAAPSGAITFASGLEKVGPKHPALQSLYFYTDFARPTKEVYSWNEEETNAFDAFIRGKTAFYFGFAYDYGRIKSRAPDLNFEVMPLLQLNPDAPANVANYWLQSVVKKSKNQNEAWDFIRFLSTADTLKKYSDATKLPSPLRVHLKAEQNDPVLANFATQLLVAKSWYKGKDIGAAEKGFDDMITTILSPADPKLTPDKVAERDGAAVARAASFVSQTLQ